MILFLWRSYIKYYECWCWVWPRQPSTVRFCAIVIAYHVVGPGAGSVYGGRRMRAACLPPQVKHRPNLRSLHVIMTAVEVSYGPGGRCSRGFRRRLAASSPYWSPSMCLLSFPRPEMWDVNGSHSLVAAVIPTTYTHYTLERNMIDKYRSIVVKLK